MFCTDVPSHVNVTNHNSSFTIMQRSMQRLKEMNNAAIITGRVQTIWVLYLMSQHMVKYTRVHQNLHSTVEMQRHGIHFLARRSRILYSYNYRCFGALTQKKFGSGSKDIPLILQNELSPTIKVDTNPYELDRHGHGESYHETKPPQAVVYPNSTQDVVEIVKLASKHKIPLIAFGAGTSVEGHVCATHGGISVDTSLLQSMELPDMSSGTWPDPIATVGSGVTRNTLNEALRHSGLQFVVDPGADATIGGMVACGASGTTTVRYGTMRENILALECVLANGEIAKVGSKALKNSAGYNLLGLMCGSEGTLGIITSVTTKLNPIPEHIAAAVCVFDTLHAAAETVASLKFQQYPLVRCELLDKASIAAFNKHTQSHQEEDAPRLMKEAPTLFLELQGSSETALTEEIERVQEICVEAGGTEFQLSTEARERQLLWKARHALYYAIWGLRPDAAGAVPIVTDSCVPLSEFANVIRATAQDVEEQGVLGPCFGHAGDGNFHCILPITPDEDPDYLRRVHAVNDRLIQRTLEAGGTCTGEHGVGYGKAKYLERQYGPGAVHMMRAIKQALDPDNIMNPGKVLPEIDE